MKRYDSEIKFIKKYTRASNAATGSAVDSNANVENKNITTLTGEIPKKLMIGINRTMMYDKQKELFGEAVAEKYIEQLDKHQIYKHDETSIYPYTYSAKEVVNVVYKGVKYLVSLEQLYDICEEQELLVDKDKIVYIKYPKDMVISDRNGYTKVERLIRKKRHRNLVRVKTSFGEDLVVTDNHPLIVNDDINDTVEAINSIGLQQYRCNTDIKFGDIKEIDLKDINASIISEEYDSCYVIQTNALYKRYVMPKKVSLDEEFGYLVGFIIGDGNYTFCNNVITDNITITQNDKEILEKLGDIAYRKFGVIPFISYKDDKSNCYILKLQNPMLVSLLYDVFKIGHMAQNKCLPINIYNYNKEFAIGIIEGLIDSDGTITSNQSIQIRVASRTLILQLSDVLRNLNFGVSNTTQDTRFGCNDKVTQKYQIFGVTFSEKNETPELKLCFKAEKSCTHDKYLKYVTNTWVKISNIDVVDNEKFLAENEFIYDITTDSHSFICNNIWVHNCVSITMYPYLFKGMKNIGGISEPPKNLQSFCGSFVNLVFAVASQFAGAVSTPEFLTYMDYFIRKEYGDDYYLRSDDVVDLSTKRRTIDSVISQCFQEVVYSLNQPAAARNYQSVFWNLAYFDRPYFESIFEDFVFPDGTEPQYESVLWLQKKFMNWFNRERLRTILTFPVETVNLLDDGVDYVDKEFADFVAEMWAKGHSFFMYRSNSVDSLASCCYSKDTYVLIKDSKGAYRVKFEDIESMKFDSNGYKIFNNGRWCKGKLVKLPNRQMYKVTLTNNKEMIVTDNHRNNVFGGVKLTKDLTTNDYLMVNSMPCFECPEIDKHLTYKDGFKIGEYIGKTDIDSISTDWVLQSISFRKGIIDGWLSQSSHCSTSKELIDGIETICNSLGYITYTCTSNNDNKEKKYHLLVCCDEVLRELSDDNLILRNNSYYFRIKSIEKVDYDDYVYCFEMDDCKDDTFTLANGIHNYNCRLRNELQDNTFSYTLGAGGVSTGSKSVITINFNRLVQDAYKYKEWRDKEEFYNYLDSKIREQVRLVHKYQIAYDDNLRDFLKAKMLPIYDAGFINMDKQFLTVGINGLVEGAEFLGIDISPNEEYFEYCTRCLKPIYEENKAAKTEHYMFNTEYVPKLRGHLAA